MKLRAVAAFFSGLIFAIGLSVSGMTQPHKVIAFLDLFGDWDPSLIFVMMGAIAVHSVSYRLIRRRSTPLLESEFHLPKDNKIRPSLVIGAILFGIGWGLGGFCPGPALVSLGSFEMRPLIFVAAMLAGIGLFKLFTHVRKTS